MNEVDRLVEAGQTIRDRFPQEQNQLIRSKQTDNKLDISSINIVDNLFLVISTLSVLLFYPLLKKNGDSTIYIAILGFIAINAAVTSIVSTVDPRYSYRILWILPMTNVALLFRYVIYPGFTGRKERQGMGLSE